MKIPSGAQYEKITLGSQLSEGSFADIYEGVAQYGSDSDEVAVKVLKVKWLQNEELIDRFKDEAHLLMSLRHSNIMAVTQLVEFQNRPAVVMERIQGIDLKTVLTRRPSPAVSFAIAESIAVGLHAAYALPPPDMKEPLEVVHRDIKPSNIMLTRKGEIKIVDFGASRFEDAGRLSETNLFQFGSPKYMPSERRLGDRGDHRSDMYSLGIVLLELLQGNELAEVPPTEQREHTRYFEEKIASLSYGLPNTDWTSSAADLMKRLCSYNPEHRLSADQTIPLLKAFSEQAEGNSLNEFSRRTIPQLMQNQSSSISPGTLTGQCFEAIPSSPPFRLKATQANTFLLATAVTATMTFLLFSAVTLAGLKLIEEPKPAAKVEPAAEEVLPVEEKEKVEVLLTISKDDFRKALVRDDFGVTVLEARATRPENKAALTPGNYTLVVQSRFSRNKKETELSIAKPQEIHCEAREEVVGCWNQSKRNLLSMD
jgi:serine/threonine protein kinase